MVYQNKKLVIYQTREVQEGIGNFLDKLRNALGHQVAIEARFLLVGENFLEDVGLDMDFRANVGGNVGLLDFQQDSSTISSPTETGITGSLVPSLTGVGGAIAAMTATGGYGSLILNDLEVSIILRATQAHRDAKSLTAPKVTVLNGERATFQIQRMRRYPYDITIDIEQIGTAVGGAIPAYMWTVDTTEGYILTGTLLNVTPIITPDKKNVLLNIETQLTDFLGWQTYDIQLPVIGATAAGGTYSLQYPETEISKVQTRVSVPDKATLLLGGQRITAEAEREAGVPVLSKVPFLGRLFSNRSKVKDSQILLILVKPTIILRDEAENKAIATMESSL
jgi:general secretion pathway protein D